MNFWSDSRFGAALASAPVLLLLALVFAPTQVILSDWPLRQPRKFLALVLLWPVLEEVVFRGSLQPLLAGMDWGRKAWNGFTTANTATSFVFASAHLLSHPPLWAMLVFLPSLLFGYFRDRHNSLFSPIILHVIYNLGYFWFFGA